MGHVKKKEGFDHAGLTRMIEALSELVSGLPMLVESTGRSAKDADGKRSRWFWKVGLGA